MDVRVTALVLGGLLLAAIVNAAGFGFFNGEGFVADADGHWPLQRRAGGIAAIAAGDPVADVRDRAAYFRLHDHIAGSTVVTFPDSALDPARLELITRVHAEVVEYEATVDPAVAKALRREASLTVRDDEGNAYSLVPDSGADAAEGGSVLWHVTDSVEHFLVPTEQARSLGVDIDA